MLGTTFGGNPLACAAAIAVLEVMENEKLMKNAEETGNYLLEKLSQNHVIKNVRGKGLMIGFDVPEEIKDLRKNLLFKHHIFTGSASPDVVRLLPPLCISKEQADVLLNAIQLETSPLKQKEIEKLSVGK